MSTAMGMGQLLYMMLHVAGKVVFWPLISTRKNSSFDTFQAIIVQTITLVIV
jgi:hypothetical protein